MSSVTAAGTFTTSISVQSQQPQKQCQSSQQQKQLLKQQHQQLHLIDAHEASATTTHLPTALGLKIRNTSKPPPQQQNQQNSNSLLKQQLRAGLKEIAGGDCGAKTTAAVESLSNNNNNNKNSADFACSALQSLASVAERQAPNALQPPTANNLHQQFLLHMAANPMLKSGNDYFQQQQQQQQEQQKKQQQQQQQQQLQQLEQQQQQQRQQLEQQQRQQLEQQQQQLQQQHQQQQQQLQLQQELQREDSMSPTNLDLILDQNDKSEPELTLADESAGLDYKSADNSADNDELLVTTNDASVDIGHTNTKSTGSRMPGAAGAGGRTSAPRRPVQRRRVRRKAQSTLDDQAEHLTEMSVRGLDLFRYARINEGVYQCTECAKDDVQKTFKNKYSFQRHAFLYHEGKHRKVFPCTLCGKEFSRPDKMKNHLKLAHENIAAKDLANFNPLNYLITAATAGEMHSTLFATNTLQQQQQQQQQQQVTDSMQEEFMDNGVNLLSSAALEQEMSRPSSPTTAAAFLKLDNDIIIKNEIVISPSPSPPPVLMRSSAEATRTTATAVSAMAAQRSTQRLEEVK